MAQDYSDIGLASNMTVQTSLTNQGTYTSAAQFDANFEGAGAQNIVSGKVTGRIIINDGQNDRVVIGKLD